MSYNGIGLQTPRGSGTNGHITKNMSSVRRREPYSTSVAASVPQLEKKRHADLAILQHEAKRQIENRILIYRTELEDSEPPLDPAQIDERVEAYRRKVEEESRLGVQVREGRTRHKAFQSHDIAISKTKEMDTLRSALGVRDNYEEGTAMKRQERQPKADIEGSELPYDPNHEVRVNPLDRRRSRFDTGRSDRRHSHRDNRSRSRSRSRRRRYNDEDDDRRRGRSSIHHRRRRSPSTDRWRHDRSDFRRDSRRRNDRRHASRSPSRSSSASSRPRRSRERRRRSPERRGRERRSHRSRSRSRSRSRRPARRDRSETATSRSRSPSPRHRQRRRRRSRSGSRSGSSSRSSSRSSRASSAPDRSSVARERSSRAGHGRAEESCGEPSTAAAAAAPAASPAPPAPTAELVFDRRKALGID